MSITIEDYEMAMELVNGLIDRFDALVRIFMRPL